MDVRNNKCKESQDKGTSKMGYTAVCLKNEGFNQKGFESKEEAHKYIEALACQVCIDDVVRGYYELEDGDISSRCPVDSILQTSCGEGWIVITDAEYDDAESYVDYLIAGGMIPSDEAKADLSEEQLEKLRKKQQELDDEKSSD